MAAIILKPNYLIICRNKKREQWCEFSGKNLKLFSGRLLNITILDSKSMLK